MYLMLTIRIQWLNKSSRENGHFLQAFEQTQSIMKYIRYKSVYLDSFTIKNKATHDIKQENMMMPTDSIRDFPYKQLGFLFLLHAV